MLAGVTSGPIDRTGVVLAGGWRRRMGGASKPGVLAGRALIECPLEALGAVCDRVAVVCKADTGCPTCPRAWSAGTSPTSPATR